MTSKTELGIYELVYHLTPDLEETGTRARAQEISDLITRGGGVIILSQEPKYSRLSYPIRHKRHSYLGVFEFSGPPNLTERLSLQIKLQNDILRFLLIKKPDKILRTLGEPRPTRTRQRVREAEMPKAKITPAESREKPTREIKTEELEKEIEEVIKGL